MFRLPRVLGALVVSLAITGCSMLVPGPEPLPGGRRWIIAVDNRTARPAVLLIGEDAMAPNPRWVGNVAPNPVAPFSAVDVTFDVPPGGGWAIFVNPRPDSGPVIIAADVPQGVSGKMPFTIEIEANGAAGTSFPGPAIPGWFGN